jgi:hypothetical protein
MSEKQSASENPEGAGRYQIRLKGHLDGRWAAWFGDVTITLEDNGETLLSAQVADQAALYGLLKRVRDVGMPLLSLQCVSEFCRGEFPPTHNSKEPN